jgi:DNA polymerase III sliding clamp (beta) subunit (PCNA family)
MELYCEQERLAAALKAVLPAVPSRSWATAEAGMLLRADAPAQAGGHLSVIATDREMAIRCQVGAQVAKPGEAVLPTRTTTKRAPKIMMVSSTRIADTRRREPKRRSVTP